MKWLAVRLGAGGEKMRWWLVVAVLVAVCVSALAAPPVRAEHQYDADVLVKEPPQPSRPQPSSPVGSPGSSGGSLFDAWWAKLFCLWLLIPVAAFVRRLFTGWLNLLGVDEERYAGLAAAGAGGLIGLGMAVGGLASALAGAVGWGAVGGRNIAGPAVSRTVGWFRSRFGGSGNPSGSARSADGAGEGVDPIGPSSPPFSPGPVPGSGGEAGGEGPANFSASFTTGGNSGGESGGVEVGSQGATAAQAGGGNSALPPEGVRGEGLPEAGDVHEARRQAVTRMREMVSADRGRAEGARARHAYLSSGVGVLGDVAQAAGAVTGAIFGIGLGGGKAAELASRAFGTAMAAPFRAFEAYMRTPPPVHRSSLDGARYRVA